MILPLADEPFLHALYQPQPEPEKNTHHVYLHKSLSQSTVKLLNQKVILISIIALLFVLSVLAVT